MAQTLPSGIKKWDPSDPVNRGAFNEQWVTIDAQLADTEQELALKAPQSALDAMNNVVSTKAPQYELDAAVVQINNRPTYDEVNNLFSELGDISPKGGFPTLAALQAAYPAGTEGLYLVAENNHVYYWSAITLTWEDGGSYQAMPWAEFMTTQNEVWEV